MEEKKRSGKPPWWAAPILGAIVRAAIAFVLDQMFRNEESPS